LSTRTVCSSRDCGVFAIVAAIRLVCNANGDYGNLDEDPVNPHHWRRLIRVWMSTPEEEDDEPSPNLCFDGRLHLDLAEPRRPLPAAPQREHVSVQDSGESLQALQARKVNTFRSRQAEVRQLKDSVLYISRLLGDLDSLGQTEMKRLQDRVAQAQYELQKRTEMLGTLKMFRISGLSKGEETEFAKQIDMLTRGLCRTSKARPLHCQAIGMISPASRLRWRFHGHTYRLLRTATKRKSRLPSYRETTALSKSISFS
jgi:hypothetical protein